MVMRPWLQWSSFLQNCSVWQSRQGQLLLSDSKKSLGCMVTRLSLLEISLIH